MPVHSAAFEHNSSLTAGVALAWRLLTSSNALDTLCVAFAAFTRHLRLSYGGLAERLMAAVLKTAVGETPPGVQIPHPPPRFTGLEFSALRLIGKARLERWVSGLNHSPAKTAYSKGTESSNLSLSAKLHRMHL